MNDVASSPVEEAKTPTKPWNRARKVLLTGWTGFLGRHVFDILCRTLTNNDELYCLSRRSSLKGITVLPANAKLTFLTGDISDKTSLAKALVNIPRLTHVIHLAAISTQDADPLETFKTNVTGTINLAKLTPPQVKFVFASSAAVFGDKLRDAPSEDESHAPTTLYGATKSACEEILASISARLTVVRLVAQCGPHATHGLVNDVFEKLMSPSETLQLRGDEPGTAKPFSLVTDTAEEIVRLCWNGPDRTYHLCPDDCITVAKVARIAMEVTGVKKPVSWLGTKSLYKGDNQVVRLKPTGLPCPKFRSSAEAVEMAFQTLADLERSDHDSELPDA